MPSARNRREFYDGRQCLTPHLRTLGHAVYRVAADSALAAHRHRGHYEVCLIARGAVDWWVGDELHHVKAGHIYVTAPGETHGGTDDVLHRCELYWLIVRLPVSGCDAAVARGFSGLRRRTFPASTALRPAFAKLMAEHRERAAYAAEGARVALTSLLVQVLRDHDRAIANSDHGETVSLPIGRAQRWMRDHLDESFTMADAAKVASLSVTQFHARFVADTGMTPNDWRLRQRVAIARRELSRTDRPITEIAMRLGFSSSQYFATSFAKVVGLSPSAFRARTTRSGKAKRPTSV
ncbi:MAG: AraC family transcriptional regulator [Planctomycetota bacterium]